MKKYHAPLRGENRTFCGREIDRFTLLLQDGIKYDPDVWCNNCHRIYIAGIDKLSARGFPR